MTRDIREDPSFRYWLLHNVRKNRKSKRYMAVRLANEKRKFVRATGFATKTWYMRYYSMRIASPFAVGRRAARHTTYAYGSYIDG